jgi:hypothetical protein
VDRSHVLDANDEGEASSGPDLTIVGVGWICTPTLPDTLGHQSATALLRDAPDIHSATDDRSARVLTGFRAPLDQFGDVASATWGSMCDRGDAVAPDLDMPSGTAGTISTPSSRRSSQPLQAQAE